MRTFYCQRKEVLRVRDLHSRLEDNETESDTESKPKGRSLSCDERKKSVLSSHILQS